VLVTKADLAADPVTVARQVAAVTPGVEVLPVSAEHGDGLAALASLIAPGRTLALLGPSGAGKSTLVNALVEAPVMRTQRVRRGDGKGQHTTTYRALVPVPGGGAVLDTPGLRAVGLLDGADGLARTFPDVDEWAAQCRFTDCSHRGEPECAVQAAVAAGELSYRRWESWQKLPRELAYQARRKNARRAAAHRTTGRRIDNEGRFRIRPR
jgi:ribosome biogenesis GTPase